MTGKHRKNSKTVPTTATETVAPPTDKKPAGPSRTRRVLRSPLTAVRATGRGVKAGASHLPFVGKASKTEAPADVVVTVDKDGDDDVLRIKTTEGTIEFHLNPAEMLFGQGQMETLLAELSEQLGARAAGDGAAPVMEALPTERPEEFMAEVSERLSAQNIIVDTIDATLSSVAGAVPVGAAILLQLDEQEQRANRARDRIAHLYVQISQVHPWISEEERLRLRRELAAQRVEVERVLAAIREARAGVVSGMAAA